jgi:hypothetical protein
VLDFRVKVNPSRFKGAGRSILRGHMIYEVFASSNGQRFIRECQKCLSRPVNSDEESGNLVLKRFADAVNLYPDELPELLARGNTE